MVADPAIQTIGASRSQNISDTPSRKECKKDSADKPVHYKGDDDIASHQRFMFIFQSHLGQEEGRKTMVDNVLVLAPAQVTQNTTESTAAPTQVTNHTQNSKDTDTKNNYED